MRIEKLISIAVKLALMAASAGRLLGIVHRVRGAQLQLIKDSQDSVCLESSMFMKMLRF